MSQTHAAPSAEPQVAHGGTVHAVAPAHSAVERDAERFADAFVGGDQGPGWSFAGQPVHAASDQGAPLTPGWQARLGAALGDDVSRVRVHQGAEAADLTRRARADAVTVGDHVALSPGAQDLTGRPGARRLAHEVAHAVRHRDSGLALRDGTGAPTPATTLAGLPEADRKRIQVVTNTVRAAPSAAELRDTYFDKGTTLGGPSDTAVVVDASVPAALTKGLTNLAGDWSTGPDPSLKPNSTFTVQLDLTAQGGAAAPYRFTFNLPPAAAGKKQQGRITVEQLGATTPPAGAAKPPEPKPGQAPPPDPVADRIKAASITYSGYGKAEEQALRGAISVVPAAHLAAVSGLRFARQAKNAADPKVAGKYFPKADPAEGVAAANTIVMYDNAFAASDVTFVEGGTATSYASRLIVHEIGHAVDLRALALAAEDVEARTAAVNAAAGTFNSAAEKKRYDDAVKAEKAAKDTLKATRSRSGTKTVDTGGVLTDEISAATVRGVGFREAVKKDGKDVSKYGEADWQESYAEAYSLFVTSPSSLLTLRPATHDYLSKNLPK